MNDEALDRCRAAHASYHAIYKDQVGATEAEINAAIQRLTYTTDLEGSVEGVDFVIEAVPEVPEIKNSFYAQLAACLPEKTIIASNSSTLLPSDFAAVTGRPEKFCALHFANYVWEYNFAEVMAHATTSEATLEQVFKFAIEIGMVPVPVEKESNGYVLNDWFMPLCQASLTLLVNGVGSAENIDRSYMLFNRGGKMGPLAMLDMVGMNTAINILNYWGNVGNDQQMLTNAEYLKTHYADKGHLGVLSGQGFYTYPNPAFESDDFLSVQNYDVVAEMVAKTKH
ncbi:3-hydroxyacyl-CoA dehydrogenase NAD-binding domain-containing protein [Vibrio sp. S11_S32]|uniref:3-hydroxyacyl-CoA dehydrogenase NAD-binding domain-containing protein n=1 Tax=Vibrio sp. S11_S32 TaxID=2720225 RepID=UPI003144F5E2